MALPHRRGGPREVRVIRWWDYPDLNTLLEQAPKWWIDHIMEGYP